MIFLVIFETKKKVAQRGWLGHTKPESSFDVLNEEPLQKSDITHAGMHMCLYAAIFKQLAQILLIYNL